MSLPTHYDPNVFEAQVYANWENSGYFKPEAQVNADAENPFCIVIPPPNVTGTLHMGHALDNSLQDVLIRWHRMRGDLTLWQPGCDHAGIATQSIVERQLAAEGKTRFDLGREAFLEKTWEWANYSKNTILGQFRRLGISPDWQRQRFTLDDGLCKAVREAFVKLYEDGLIYQGDYIVNWSVGLQSAISDIETEYSDEDSFLWHINYPLTQDPSQHLTVATTRPETMFGDVAVAVHPEDERYKALIGQTVTIPLTSVQIPIIADEAVEKDFGTGALKITPAHDPNDFEIGKRHNLTPVLIMNAKAELTNAERVPDAFLGLERFEARKAIEAALHTQGFLQGKEPHAHRVGRCQRSGTVVEPMLSKQWFVKTTPMAQKCLKALDNGDIKFIPERWNKVYRDWMENIRDWCVSRQLWWGHQIPAWHCQECGQVTVDRQDPSACKHCNSPKLQQDPDVLDTWFSSGLWPFSTLGWPNTEAPDFKQFYPTQTLVTGFDIIFFWVARMTMMGHQLTGQTPFNTVYIHGLVRDENGQKMSKSKGNVIDPVDSIEEYGCDALRYGLISLVTYGGQDIKLTTERFEQGKLFCNKLWNATRFVLMNLEGVDSQAPVANSLNAFDEWILLGLDATITTVNQQLKEYRLGEALQTIETFAWNQFCDWYVEAAKRSLKDDTTKANTQRVLRLVLETILKLLHPFMPFITETLWQQLPHKQGDTLSLSHYPTPTGIVSNHSKALEHIDVITTAIRAIRNKRQEANIPSATAIELVFVAAGDTEQSALQTHQDWLTFFIKNATIQLPFSENGEPATITGVFGQAKFWLIPEGGVDVAAEREKQEQKLAKLQAEKDKLDGLLGNDAFVAKAPEAVITKNKARQSELAQQIEAITAQLKQLSAC